MQAEGNDQCATLTGAGHHHKRYCREGWERVASRCCNNREPNLDRGGDAQAGLHRLCDCDMPAGPGGRMRGETCTTAQNPSKVCGIINFPLGRQKRRGTAGDLAE